MVSKAKMATSLLDMFKPTTTEADDGGDGGGGGGFSLLDQFDKTDTSTAGDKGGSQESGEFVILEFTLQLSFFIDMMHLNFVNKKNDYYM